jgi:hypothetical protein
MVLPFLLGSLCASPLQAANANPQNPRPKHSKKSFLGNKLQNNRARCVPIYLRKMVNTWPKAFLGVGRVSRMEGRSVRSTERSEARNVATP